MLEDATISMLVCVCKILSLHSRNLILDPRNIIKLAQALMPLGIRILAIKKVGMLLLVSRLVNVKLVALPAVLPGIQVVGHAEDAIVHGHVGAHALQQGRVLDRDQLTVVGRAGEVDDADAAEVALVDGRLDHAVDGGLEEAAREALKGFAKVDDEAVGLVLNPAVLARVVAEDLEGGDGLAEEERPGAPVWLVS